MNAVEQYNVLKKDFFNQLKLLGFSRCGGSLYVKSIGELRCFLSLNRKRGERVSDVLDFTPSCFVFYSGLDRFYRNAERGINPGDADRFFSFRADGRGQYTLGEGEDLSAVRDRLFVDLQSVLHSVEVESTLSSFVAHYLKPPGNYFHDLNALYCAAFGAAVLNRAEWLRELLDQIEVHPRRHLPFSKELHTKLSTFINND